MSRTHRQRPALRFRCFAAGLLPLGLGVSLASVDAQDADTQKLQQAAQNPISIVISLPIQNNVNFNVGSLDKTGYVMNVQPVYPVALNEDWNLINRVIAPVIYQPELFVSDDSEFGLGDLTTQQFFSPAKPVDSAIGEITWGVGPSFQLPTATDTSLGSGKWAIGTAGVVFIVKGRWTYGSLLTNVWSFAGDSSRGDVNVMTLQPFLNYNLSDGWAIGTAPVITANWEAASGNRWTVPVGGGVSKLFRVGKQPINAILRGNYNVVRPAAGPGLAALVPVEFSVPEEMSRKAH